MKAMMLLLWMWMGLVSDVVGQRRNATALLVKPNIDKKSMVELIARQTALMHTSWGHQVDHIFFHEPGTDLSQLQSKFKNIIPVPVKNFLLPEPANTKSDVCTIGTSSSLGYRSMCWFWYATAWEMLAELDYQFVIRVDDDVVLKAAEPWPENPEMIAAASWANKEIPWVVSGMEKWFRKGYKLPDEPWAGPAVTKRNWQIPPSPMTQLMIMNVQAVVNHAGIRKLWQEVYDTNCIYINRWGDLPLWGFTIAALGLPTTNLSDWEYFHGSHHKIVKSGWYTF